MWTHAVFIAALLASDQSAPAPARDPRTQPLTIEDALFTIPYVTGRIVPVRDADGDGLGDLMIVRGGNRFTFDRIDVVSSKSGAAIRTLYTVAFRDVKSFAWDGGGDVDGDGIADLIVGLPEFEEQAGRALVLSGKSGETLLEFSSPTKGDRWGSTVAFIGDVDGDGHCDVAISALQFDPARKLSAPSELSSTAPPTASFWAERMSKAFPLPGYVSLRSGRDGKELWRKSGEIAGHRFGMNVRSVADLDQDGASDVLIQSHFWSDQPIVLVSGRTGQGIATLKHRLGLAGPVGDLDHDGVCDFFLDEQDEHLIGRTWRVQFVSGKTRAPLFELPYPDFWTEYAVTVPMGDLDADGVADVAIGDGNYNIKRPQDPGGSDTLIDLRKLTLTQALALESDPWNAFTWESGCAFAYSGRTHEVILGVFGLPGSRRGVGLEVAPLPDVNGDGHPDVIVADEDRAYVFAGPGPEPK